MVWHGHILSSDIVLVFVLVLLAIGLVLSHRPGNPGANEHRRMTHGEPVGPRSFACLSLSLSLSLRDG